MEQQDFLRGPAVWQPGNEGEAWSLKRQLGPDAVYAAGSTLLRTWWEGGAAKVPAHLIDVRLLPGIAGIAGSGKDGMKIGAGASLSEIRRSPELASAYSALSEAAMRIGAPSVRNLGTIGGNAVSGIGDSLPALLVYDAELVWYGGQEERIPLAVWLGDREAGRTEADRLLLRISLPPRGGADGTDGAVDEAALNDGNKCLRHFSFYQKVGRREAFTPSVMTAAIAGKIDGDGRLLSVRAAAGGGSAVPQRLYAVEALLEGNAVSERLLSEVYEAVTDTFRPRGDAFASEAYRKRAAANVLSAALWKLAAAPERKG